jgi:hypothetical protein
MYICFVIFKHLSAQWNVPYDPFNYTCICEFCATLSAILRLTILSWSTYIRNVFTSKQVNSRKQQKYGHCSWWDLKPIFSVLAKASSNSPDPTLNSGVWIVNSSSQTPMIGGIQNKCLIQWTKIWQRVLPGPETRILRQCGPAAVSLSTRRC